MSADVRLTATIAPVCEEGYETMCETMKPATAKSTLFGWLEHLTGAHRISG